MVAVTARPILFSGPMVRALMEGRKTQTRRVVKPQPSPCDHEEYNRYNGRVIPTEFSRDEDGSYFCITCGNMALDDMRCRHGVPGGLLYVREKWAPLDRYTGYDAGYDAMKAGGFYAADYPPGDLDDKLERWTPSILMPRRASRVTLRVKAVRVERLNDISDADAIAEGIEHGRWLNGYRNYLLENDRHGWVSPVDAFSSLWRSINGLESWAENPWVWVLSFEVIKANVDQVIKEAA